MAHGRRLDLFSCDLLFRSLLLLTVGLVAGVAARPACADTIRLRDGTVLDVESATVLDGRVRLRMVREGSVVPVEFPFARFRPRTVLKLYDRDTDPGNARQRLRGAWIALDVGLAKEARRRFEDAARLDPDLASEVETGLTQLRALDATRAFEALADRLRKGKDPAKVHEGFEALLVGPHAMYLSVAQLKRIEVLSKLAQRLAQREADKKEAERRKRKPKRGKKPRKPKPKDKPPRPRPDTEVSPYAPGSYADKRWRERRGFRPSTPKVPGRARPPLQGERGKTGGGDPGSPRGGQGKAQPSGPGGARGGQGGGSAPGQTGGGQGSGLGR